jgi:hypothetical protein
VPTEKELDTALERAFAEDPGFVDWFTEQTRFAGRGAHYSWSRSNNAYSKFPFAVEDPVTGAHVMVTREGETDVLVVLEDRDGVRLALHIENKLRNSSFTPDQPAMYHARAKHWIGQKRYGEYTHFLTVLVAPERFRERNPKLSTQFDHYISHEKIASHVPAFNYPR